jgi:hypothetical protein
MSDRIDELRQEERKYDFALLELEKEVVRDKFF